MSAQPLSCNHLLLDVRDLAVHFHAREGAIRAVDGVSFSLRRGETLGIVGESGCGKSVTSQAILRIVPKNGHIVSGSIVYSPSCGGEPADLVTLRHNGRRMRGIRGSKIAMVFQEPMTSFSPVRTIGAQIIEVITLHQEISMKDARGVAIEMLDRVGMPKPKQLVDAYPFALSGGMRQRAMIAMALSCRPELLIADEPTTAVDVTIQAQILKLLRDLQGEFGMALLIITHDLSVIASLADTVMVMYLGRDVEQAPVDDLFHAPKHPYTKGLLSSVPRLGRGSAQAITPIRGAVPGPHEMPSGCTFHPRCDSFIPGVCDAGRPPQMRLHALHTASCYLYSRGPAHE